MALIPKELFGTPIQVPQALRAYPEEDGIYPGTLAQQSAVTPLANLTPLYFDETAQTWKVWIGDVSEINTLTAHATTPATAGTFTITVNGQTTAGIAFNATAAVIQAALEALSNVAPGDVVVTSSGANIGTAADIVTLTWAGALAGSDVTISITTTGLTGNPPVLATGTAGGTATVPGSEIDAFLWAPDEDFVPSITGEVTIQVFRAGVIHVADIPVPAGESRVDLYQQLLVSNMREKNITLQGLVGVH